MFIRHDPTSSPQAEHLCTGPANAELVSGFISIFKDLSEVTYAEH
jgi:hypothetical protein